jgi:hypothetical protein
MTKLTNAEMISFLVAEFKMSAEEAAAVIEALQTNDDIADEAYETFFEYYCNNGEMPYGTAKARDGDPIEWVCERVAAELGI